MFKADPATGFKFCNAKRLPGSWRKVALLHAEEQFRSPGFSLSFAGDSQVPCLHLKRARLSPSGFCQEMHFHKPNNTVFVGSGMTSSLLIYGVVKRSYN